MKEIDVEFINIQSHEHTKFHFSPGLNFILAEDNNVGKSTIFKVLMCAMQLPNIAPADIDELIRGGTTQARAAFKFDGITCTLWFIREGGRASKAFFETVFADGHSARSLGAPTVLRDAFDIVTSEDGEVINFNDADSVQLIVQDTPKNDAVLSRVLVDVRVDDIKAKAIKLNQQIQQDYRMVNSKLEDVSTVLSSMHYVDGVDNFFAEKSLLSSACYIADAVCDIWDALEIASPLPCATDLPKVRAALNLYEGLSDITLVESSILNAVSPEMFVELKNELAIISKLEQATSELQTRALKITAKQLEGARQGIAILDKISKAESALYFMQSASKDMQRLEQEKQTVLEALESKTTRVVCPVRGEVFYSDEECVPCSDRSAL